MMWECNETNSIPSTNLQQAWVAMIALASTWTHYSSSVCIGSSSDLIGAERLASFWVGLAQNDGMEGVVMLWECCGPPTKVPIKSSTSHSYNGSSCFQFDSPFFFHNWAPQIWLVLKGWLTFFGILVHIDGMECNVVLWECCEIGHMTPTSLHQAWVTILGLAPTSTHHSSFVCRLVRICFLLWKWVGHFLEGCDTLWWHGRYCDDVRVERD